jgi:ribosome maturation factor RimP
MENLTLEEKLYQIIEEQIAETDIYVIDMRLKGGYGNRILEIILDTDTGIGIDECMRYGKRIKRYIEENEIIEGAYGMEVSSPGATRPLEIPRQYKKHIGRILKVKFRSEEGYQTVEGTLNDCNAENISITLENNSTLVLAFEDIAQAKVVLPW